MNKIIETKTLRRFIEGDPEAVTEVYLKVNPILKKDSRKFMSDNFNEHDAEQACSEAWLKTLKTKHCIKNPKTTVSYIKNVLRNCCLDMLRKKSSSESSTDLNMSEDGVSMRNSIPCNRTMESSVSVIEKEEKDTLYSLIASLEPIYYEALTGVLEGKSYEALAEQCECPLGTLKRRVFHAKKLLMEKSVHLREVL